jgi:hypothetical protein
VTQRLYSTVIDAFLDVTTAPILEQLEQGLSRRTYLTVEEEFLEACGQIAYGAQTGFRGSSSVPTGSRNPSVN